MNADVDGIKVSATIHFDFYKVYNIEALKLKYIDNAQALMTAINDLVSADMLKEAHSRMNMENLDFSFVRIADQPELRRQ